MATSKKTIIIRSEFTPSGLNHNISHYLNRLHLSRAHHFLNQASLQCSCPLGSVVQLEACEQKKEILILTLRPSLCSGYKVCKALRHSSRSRYCRSTRSTEWYCVIIRAGQMDAVNYSMILNHNFYHM